jgi:hypothetical protein
MKPHRAPARQEPISEAWIVRSQCALWYSAPGPHVEWDRGSDVRRGQRTVSEELGCVEEVGEVGRDRLHPLLHLVTSHPCPMDTQSDETPDPSASRGTSHFGNLPPAPAFSDQEATMDAQSDDLWSEMDIGDLTNELARGRTIEETATFLSRDLDDVRQKAKELGWSNSVP